ncbi:hypothetical protein [Spiroplasma monobiae]|uniref:Transmembrane protein n=1 Tax=Spiroplasma monobiae MQ-1 TaxID=1336748 RepID=A0A2K9LUZ5_SPISQ|nr:hypothetical protein [Spiroplasma monobiae]AUM62869.1 hypothetical protein SMONO_v1c06200 [Spiroplasma monobiae MQ-1]
MFLSDTTDIINTVLSAVSTITVFTASLLIPFLVKKYNDKKQKGDAAENSLLDAFDKYFSDDYPKNDFEWYLAEIRAVIKKYEIKIITCTNCKKKCSSSNYMEWFTTVDKVIPEVNNFSFKVGKVGFSLSLNCLYCYKCSTKKVTKKAIT